MPNSRLHPDTVRALAGQHCRDCSWYHGFWPLLRLLGFGTVPEDHETFYRNAAAAIDRPVERVVVCGTADGSMPLLISRILLELGHRPSLTILDRCETPLRVSERECAVAALPLRTVCADALDAKLSRFDLVVTHSFLGYFTEVERALLMRRWRSWLRPGGWALTVNRIRPQATGTVTFSEREAAGFSRSVVAATGAEAGMTRMCQDEVGRAAALYTRRFRIQPVRSAEEVLGVARSAGLSGSAQRLGVLSQMVPTGPTTRGSGDYWGFTFKR